MDLPPALLRMLSSACENDQLKNWSIYQEHDGNYTVKIRFVSTKVGHVKQDTHSSSFRRKNYKQLRRDSDRFENWRERRMTRSQTRKQANLQVASEINGATPVSYTHLTLPTKA